MKSGWLILTGLFWLGMNVLLWRSEYGGGSQGNPLPVKTVISKILDTPDPSEMDIFYQEKPLGHCRWVVTQVGLGDVQDDASDTIDVGDDVDLEAAEMSGLIRDVRSYIVSVDGYVQGEENPRRIQFMLNIRLDRKWGWIKFDGKIGFRNQWLHLHADKEEEALVLEIEQEESELKTQLTFEQLKNPQALIGQLTQENPLVAITLTPLMGLMNSFNQSETVTPLQTSDWAKNWNAFSDWMTIAHSRTRIYRLESGEGRKRKLTVTVNRAGEIISVNAPQKISLRNENVLGL